MIKTEIFNLSPNEEIELTIQGESKGPRPKENSSCLVKITNVKKFVDSPSDYLTEPIRPTIIIGDSNTLIDRAIDLSLQTLHANQNAKFCLRQNIDEKIVIVECNIHLKALTVQDNFIFCSEISKIALVSHHKYVGVELFKLKRNKDAFYRFSKGFKILKCIDPSPENLKTFKYFQIALYNNMAQCHLLEKNFHSVVELCTKLLELDSCNVKALYRRGNAYLELKQFTNASADFSKILEIEPLNNLAKEKFLISRQNEKVQNADFVAIVKKMFI